MITDTPIRLRTATRPDAAAIFIVHQQAVRVLCATHYPADLIHQWMEKRTVEGYISAIDRAEMIVCELGDQVIGFGHAVPGEILAIFVHPDHVQHGAGSLLLSGCLAAAQRSHNGSVRLQSTLNARDFYARRGFRETARYDVTINHAPIPVVEMEIP